MKTESTLLVDCQRDYGELASVLADAFGLVSHAAMGRPEGRLSRTMIRALCHLHRAEDDAARILGGVVWPEPVTQVGRAGAAIAAARMIDSAVITAAARATLSRHVPYARAMHRLWAHERAAACDLLRYVTAATAKDQDGRPVLDVDPFAPMPGGWPKLSSIGA